MMTILQTMQHQVLLQCEEQRQQREDTRQLIAAMTEANKKRPPTLPPISDIKHLEQELRRFKLHMDVHKVSRAKWPIELQAIFKGDALDAFLAVPASDANSYDAVKDALLIHAGISPTDRLQRLLHFNPCRGATAAQFFGVAKDILNNLQRNLTTKQFIDQLALEFTYRAAQPHITSFVHALHQPKPIEAICELDQYVVARDQDHDKIWKRVSINHQAQWPQMTSHTLHYEQTQSPPTSFNLSHQPDRALTASTKKETSSYK